MVFRHLVIVVFFLFCVQHSQAQKFSFVNYNTEQGLSQSQVTSICQDNKGYLWIGTIGGLDRFNGDDFKQFSDKDGLLNNRINTLSYFDNKLFIGHDGGVSIIYNDSITSYLIKNIGANDEVSVSKIIAFNGKTIICTNGHGAFELINGKIHRTKNYPEDFLRIKDATVSKGKLFLATSKGVLSSVNGESFSVEEMFLNEVCSGITNDSDFLIVSTFNNGVYKKRLRDGKVFHWDDKKLKSTIYGCFLDDLNRIWLETLNGIIRIESDHSISFFNQKNGMPIDMVSCFYKDSEGNVWIGSQGKGFFRFPHSNFQYYDKEFGLPSELILTGFQDSQSGLFLGTYDKGIVKIDTKGNATEIPTISNTIWCSVNDVDNKKWFGSSKYLVSIDELGKVAEISDFDEPNLPGSKITALFKVNSNAMYIGGNRGVSLFRNGKFKKLKTTLITGTIRDFEIHNGQVYFASEFGVFKIVNEEIILVKKLSRVFSIKSYKEQLWVGTDSGLYSWINKNLEQVITMDDVSSRFNNFLNIRDDILFVGTNNGLFEINLSNDSLEYVRYGIGDGLVDLETNLNSSFFDNKGDLWFGTASGLVKYNIDDRNRNVVRPKVILKGIQVNYRPIEYAYFSSQLDQYGLPLDLSLPSSKNNLSFQLDGISLSHRKGVRYQYKLIGQYDNWSSMREEPSLLFTNLEAGSYELHVRALDFNGNFSKELIFPFEVATVFYLRWWFILLSIAFTIGVVILFFQNRVTRINRKHARNKVLYKAKLMELEQKSINASMNRHFIFNSLNSIQYFINTQDKLSANKYLTSFAKLIRKNLDAVTSGDNVVSLEDEIDRIKLYLSLEAMRFNDKFDYDILIEDVDIESVMIPPMVMQPFIENSIIHGILPNKGTKGELIVKVYKENGLVQILITDNGIGFSVSKKKKDLEGGDHRSQGMEITSKRIQLMHENASNKLHLLGPVDRYDNENKIVGTQVKIVFLKEEL